MKTAQNTKVRLGFNRIERLRDLDELARLLFPGNRNHQKIFLAIFLELKYAENDYVQKLTFIAKKYDVSRRSLQRVRSKSRKLGLIDHVSRFSQKLGYREGWALSTRFERSLEKLAEKVAGFKEREQGANREQKDWDALDYL